jgi:DNA polymerase-3 subunit gamma/tau
MLTNPAFNALLRTLEEPPPHGKFILATTDIHKVPSTIISRCQRFDFNRITEATIGLRLSTILKDEGIASDEESIGAVSRKADGSMRDALSLMDQVIAYAGESIKIDDVASVIGLIPIDVYFDYSLSISEKDSSKMMGVLKIIQTTGLPLEDVAQGLNQHFRNLIIATINGGGDLLDLNDDHKNRYFDEAKSWNSKDLLRVSKVLDELEYSLKRVTQPLISFEMAAMKLLEMDTSISIAELLSGVESNQIKKNPNPAKKVAVEIKPSSIPTPAIKEEPRVSNSKPVKEELVVNSKISLEEIDEKWGGFVGKIHKERPSIGTALEHSVPFELNGSKLTIMVYDMPKFSVGNLNRNNQVIERFIEEHYGVALKVKAERGERKDSDKKNKTVKKIEEPNQFNDDNKDNVVTRVLEVFDGEILR